MSSPLDLFPLSAAELDRVVRARAARPRIEAALEALRLKLGRPLTFNERREIENRELAKS